MIFKPTRSIRNVVLAVHINKRVADYKAERTSDGRIVARICALFADHERITEMIFKERDEAALLSRFWKTMRVNDRIFCADVANVLEFVRRRSWDLRVIPSPEIHLRQVYCHELWDAERMWTRSAIRRGDRLRLRGTGRTHSSSKDASGRRSKWVA